jgi:hypothetical protein
MRLGGTSLARSVDWQAYAEKAVCQPGRLGRFGWLAKKLTKTHDIFEEYAHYRRQCNLWIRTQHLRLAADVCWKNCYNMLILGNL